MSEVTQQVPASALVWALALPACIMVHIPVATMELAQAPLVLVLIIPMVQPVVAVILVMTVGQAMQIAADKSLLTIQHRIETSIFAIFE